MTAGTPQLRPMSAGDILDRAIRIYRQSFVPLVTIVALVTVPFALVRLIAAGIMYPLSGSQVDAGAFDTGRMLFGQGILSLATLAAAVAAIFQNAALATFVSEKFLGRDFTVRRAYGRALHRWLSLLIAAFLIGVVASGIVVVLFAVFLVPFIGIAAMSPGLDSGTSAALGVLFLVFCCLLAPALIVAAFLFTRWAFFIQAIVVENYNSTGGMGRSWKLVKGSFWRVFLLLIVIWLIIFLFSLGPSLLITFGATLLASPLLLALASEVSNTVVTLIMTPLQFAALTVLYYDLRIRKEGFDLQMRMQQTPPNVPPAIPAPAEPEPSSAPPASGEPPPDLPPLYSRDDYVSSRDDSLSLRDKDTNK